MEGSSIIWQNIVDWIGGANLMGSKVLNSLIGDETCRDSGGKKLRCQKEGWHGLGHGARVCTLVVYFGHLSRSSVSHRKPWSFGPDIAMATSLASSTYNGSCSLQGTRWLRRDVPPCVLFPFLPSLRLPGHRTSDFLTSKPSSKRTPALGPPSPSRLFRTRKFLLLRWFFWFQCFFIVLWVFLDGCSVLHEVGVMFVVCDWILLGVLEKAWLGYCGWEYLQFGTFLSVYSLEWL